MNWFEKHLNWTIVLSLAASYLIYFMFVESTSNVFIWLVLLVSFVTFTLIVAVWALTRKGRSLWWLLVLYFVPFGIIVFLCLENKNLEDSQNNYFELCKNAHSLYLKKKDSKAVSLYKRAIEINPSHPLAHEGLGLIHHTNAQKIHREYSMFPGGDWLMFGDEISPEEDENNSILKTSRADLQFGNRKIAIKEFEEAANLSNDIAKKVYLLHKAAEIHCIIDIEDGIKAYEQILHIAPDDVPAHFHLAGCYATSYGSYKRESPTNSYYKRFSTNDKRALKEYKYIKENAPNLVSDLESILTNANIRINSF